MRRPWLKGIFALSALSLLLASCGAGGTNRQGGFVGLGEGHVSTLGAEISGSVQFKGFPGNGKIVVEARSSFPCPQGQCPLIERPPLGVEQLSSPGPFTLPLKELEENLIIIASYFNEAGQIRVAFQLLEDPQKDLPTVKLSLDRPYGPLR